MIRRLTIVLLIVLLFLPGLQTTARVADDGTHEPKQTHTHEPDETETKEPVVTSTPPPAVTSVVTPIPGATGAAPGAKPPPGPPRATSPTLLTLGAYSVLGATTVTNVGPSTMPGNLGVSPGAALTGFPPGVVGPPGTKHAADANAAAAQAENVATFGAIDQPCVTTFAGVQDLTLVSPLGPGVYCATGAFLLTGNLTLNGSGVWIFKSASSLTAMPGSSVTGGGCNVWWRVVSSATIGVNSTFVGNILALTSITLQTGASLNGRALAQTGQVSLASNIIGGGACLTTGGGGGGGGTGGTGSGTTSTGGGSGTTGASGQAVRRLPATGYTGPDALFVPMNSSAPIGQIVYPAANITANIVEAGRSGDTWEVSTLGMAAGHLSGTSQNFVLAGHDAPGSFTGLFKAKIGDTLTLRQGGHETMYRVISVSNVTPRAVQFVAQDGPARLTLITCLLDQKTQSFVGRLVVVAVPQ